MIYGLLWKWGRPFIKVWDPYPGYGPRTLPFSVTPHEAQYPSPLYNSGWLVLGHFRIRSKARELEKEKEEFDNDEKAAESIKLVEDSENIKWHVNSTDPRVEYEAKYENIGDQSVKCVIHFAIGSIDPDGDREERNASWQETFRVPHELNLKPGESKKVKGVLRWIPIRGKSQKVQYPDPSKGDNPSLYCCAFQE